MKIQLLLHTPSKPRELSGKRLSGAKTPEYAGSRFQIHPRNHQKFPGSRQGMTPALSHSFDARVKRGGDLARWPNNYKLTIVKVTMQKAVTFSVIISLFLSMPSQGVLLGPIGIDLETILMNHNLQQSLEQLEVDPSTNRIDDLFQIYSWQHLLNLAQSNRLIPYLRFYILQKFKNLRNTGGNEEV